MPVAARPRAGARLASLDDDRSQPLLRQSPGDRQSDDAGAHHDGVGRRRQPAARRVARDLRCRDTDPGMEMAVLREKSRASLRWNENSIERREELIRVSLPPPVLTGSGSRDFRAAGPLSRARHRFLSPLSGISRNRAKGDAGSARGQDPEGRRSCRRGARENSRSQRGERKPLVTRRSRGAPNRLEGGSGKNVRIVPTEQLLVRIRRALVGKGPEHCFLILDLDLQPRIRRPQLVGFPLGGIRRLERRLCAVHRRREYSGSRGRSSAACAFPGFLPAFCSLRKRADGASGPKARNSQNRLSEGLGAP